MNIRSLALILLLAAPALGQAEGLTDEQYEDRIMKLEYAAEVLDEMGYETGLEAVQHAANRLREGRRRAKAEHEGLHEHEREHEREHAHEHERAPGHEGEREAERDEGRFVTHVLRLAHDAMREAGKHDYAEVLQHALAAHGRQHEGHADGHGPDLGMVIELLQLAARYYREWDMPDRAEATNGLAERLAAHRREGAVRSEHGGREAEHGGREAEHGGRDGGNAEIEWVRDGVKAMRLAAKAWAEADRPEAAELCRRSYRALEMSLEGHDRQRIRREIGDLPDLGQRAELLMGAAEIYREWGMPDRAEFTAGMGRKLREAHHRRQERAAGPWTRAPEREAEREAERDRRRNDRVRDLQRRLEDLQRQLEEVRSAVNRIER